MIAFQHCFNLIKCVESCYDNVTNAIKYTTNAKQYLFKANVINLSAFPRDNRSHFLLSTLLTVNSSLRPGQINSNNSSLDLSAAETAHRMLLIPLLCHGSMVLACQSRHLFPSNEDVKISCDIHTIAHSISITALKSSPLSAADVRRLTAPCGCRDCFSSVRVHCAATMQQQWCTVDITDERRDYNGYTLRRHSILKCRPFSTPPWRGPGCGNHSLISGTIQKALTS